MFDTLIQYWQLTGDTKYNNIVTEALVAQKGLNNDFMPSNQTKTEGNDDQAFWALAAMSAVEAQLPESANASWLSLAEAVFNDQVSRWDTATCDGGLRWQIFAFNSGYSYKNAVSNGMFFQLASRLARYTGNSTYSEWASKAYTWSKDVSFIDSKFNVFDGADVSTNCTNIDKIQFSSTAGSYIAGAAYMYNTTSGSSEWKAALDSLLNQTLSVFFPSSIAIEVACETQDTCDVDQKAMKGILAQQLTSAIKLAPYTTALILPNLNATAQAAAKACSETGTDCGIDWSKSDASASGTGLGQQLTALSYVQALLVGQASDAVASSSVGSNGTTTTGSSSTTSSSPNSTTTKSAAVMSFGGHISSVFMMGLFGAAAWIVL